MLAKAGGWGWWCVLLYYKHVCLHICLFLLTHCCVCVSGCWLGWAALLAWTHKVMEEVGAAFLFKRVEEKRDGLGTLLAPPYWSSYETVRSDGDAED